MRLPVLTAATLACSLSLASGAFAQDRPPPPEAGKAGEPGPRPRPRLSPADREALFDARIAGLRAGLKLTPDQEKLWPPVEAALRAAAKSAAERREKMRGERPADMVAWLKRAGEDSVERGENLKAIADAAAPLNKSLSEDQKRRLPILLHGIRPMAMGPMRHPMGMGSWPMGGHGGHGGPAEAGPAGAPPPPPPPPPGGEDDDEE